MRIITHYNFFGLSYFALHLLKYVSSFSIMLRSFLLFATYAFTCVFNWIKFSRYLIHPFIMTVAIYSVFLILLAAWKFFSFSYSPFFLPANNNFSEFFRAARKGDLVNLLFFRDGRKVMNNYIFQITITNIISLPSPSPF